MKMVASQARITYSHLSAIVRRDLLMIILSLHFLAKTIASKFMTARAKYYLKPKKLSLIRFKLSQVQCQKTSS